MSTEKKEKEEEEGALNEVGWRSSWWSAQREKQVDRSCQTEEVSTLSASTQSKRMSEAATQSKASEGTPTTRPSENEDEALVSSVRRMASSLQRFLSPSSSSPLIDALALHADEALSCRLLFKLKGAVDGFSSSSSSSGASSAVALSLSSSGTSLYVGTGDVEHAEWCTHSSLLFSFNLLRQVETPQRSLELSSCVSALAAHPSQPCWIAVGLYNGEIRLEDMSDDAHEDTLFHTTIDDLHHLEAITSLTWLDRTTLLASSAEGKILTWHVDINVDSLQSSSAAVSKALHPLHGQLLHPSTVYSGKGESNRHPSLSQLCLSVSLDKRKFVTATPGGGLMHGELHNEENKVGVKIIQSGEYRWTREAYALLDECNKINKFECKIAVEKYANLNAVSLIDVPLVFASRIAASLLYRQAAIFSYAGHDGPVSCVDFSPFHNDIFASASYDGTCRLWFIGAKEALLTLYPPNQAYLYTIAWSAVRPCVLACSDAKGFTHVFDLCKDALLPVLTIDHTLFGACCQLRFHSHTPSILMAATISGTTLLWRLSDALVDVRSSELNVLQTITQARSSNV